MLPTFIETHAFSAELFAHANDDELRALQDELRDNPNKGNLIQGTGGLRKIRMRIRGRGKSGGLRVIYLFLESYGVIYRFKAYPKSRQANLTESQKKVLKSVAEEIKRGHRFRLF